MTDFVRLARDAADDARLLFEARRYDGACSRAYYAMFNMARGLLALRGHSAEDAKTHGSILRLFSRELVLPGLLDPDDGRALRRAGQTRHAADYEGGVSADEAADVMASLELFMQRASYALAKLEEKDQSP